MVTYYKPSIEPIYKKLCLKAGPIKLETCFDYWVFSAVQTQFTSDKNLCKRIFLLPAFGHHHTSSVSILASANIHTLLARRSQPLFTDILRTQARDNFTEALLGVYRVASLSQASLVYAVL